jgi:hypothetical protein
MKKNIITGAESENWPNVIGATINATPEQAQADGWRDVPPQPPLEAGYTRISATFGEGLDGVTGAWTVVDRATAEIEAEAEQARLASLVPLMGQAHLFRALLQRHFGAGAEVNRAITADAVTGYFATATGLSGDDVRDGVLLKELFETLAAWNGTGETWTLFEKYGEVVP